MTDLVVATRNTGKLREMRALLAGVSVVCADDLGLDLEVAETGSTFAANAQIKAAAYARATGLPALADDSGLEVDALHGEPGVHSARYGGPGLSDADRWQRLLAALAGYPAPEQRTARFRCCIVVCAPDGRRCHADGTCEGRIAPAPAGDGGFGYDPVFHLPEHGCTMAQLPADIKNRISHRARALAAVRPALLRTFPELLGG